MLLGVYMYCIAQHFAFAFATKFTRRIATPHFGLSVKLQCEQQFAFVVCAGFIVSGHKYLPEMEFIRLSYLHKGIGNHQDFNCSTSYAKIRL